MRSHNYPLCLLVIAFCAACTFSLDKFKQCPIETTAPSGDTVEVRFLGVSGFLISRGPASLLTGPSYSNPSLGEAYLEDIHTDEHLIDNLLPPKVQDVQAILIGHSHYDHLMDVPYIADHYATNAKIYGSDTMRYILMGDPVLKNSGRLMSVEPYAHRWAMPPTTGGGPGPQGQQGQWIVDSNKRFRFMAIESEHNPQLAVVRGILKKIGGGINPLSQFAEPATLWRATVDDALDELPRRSSDWVEGSTFAYLIDFLDASQKPVFRIYYQDTGTRLPLGGVPVFPKPEDKRRIDLAILCVAGFEFVGENLPDPRKHPQAIVADTAAVYYLLGHWENLFLQQQPRLPLDAQGQPQFNGEKTFQEVPFGHTSTFLKQLKKAMPPDSHYCLPCPETVLYFQKDAAGLWHPAPVAANGGPAPYCQ
jgi:hypothetical protein